MTMMIVPLFVLLLGVTAMAGSSKAGCSGTTSDWSCCSASSPCQENEGDCDSDSECAGSLVCGTNNCKNINTVAHPTADCCIEKVQWSGIQTKIWGNDDCNYLNVDILTVGLEDCKKKCLETATCTAINYNKRSKDCVLRGCTQPVKPPQWQYGDYRGYYIMDQNAKGLVLYEDTAQRGRSRWITGPVHNFGKSFNDVVSSVHGIKGDWELYSHTNYWGHRMIVKEGAKINVDRNDHYSSARPICQYEDDPSTAKLRIYEHISRQGDMKDFMNEEKNLHNDNWGDKISSLYAMKGDWELYEHINYEGNHMLVPEGQQINVKKNVYSSLRPYCQTYSPKCKPVRIEILDNFKSILNFKGTQIIGAASGFSCNDPSTKTLTLSHVNSVTKSISLGTSTSEGTNWSRGASVSITAKAEFLGSGTEVTGTISASKGGSSTVTNSETETFTSGHNKLVGSSTSYSTPGAAIAFGTVDIYEVDNRDVPVKIHLDCPGGVKKERMSTMKLTAQTIQSADFWDVVKSVDPKDCNKGGYISKVDKCIRDVKARYLRQFGEREKIRKDFNNCFA